MKSALRIGQIGRVRVDRGGLSEEEGSSSGRHRSHSTEFKRQVVAEYHAGETLHALSRRDDLSRNLVRVRVEKAEAGAFDDEEAVAEPLSSYEARIAALERLVGRQALEIELLCGDRGSASR